MNFLKLLPTVNNEHPPGVFWFVVGVGLGNIDNFFLNIKKRLKLTCFQWKVIPASVFVGVAQ